MPCGDASVWVHICNWIGATASDSAVSSVERQAEDEDGEISMVRIRYTISEMRVSALSPLISRRGTPSASCWMLRRIGPANGSPGLSNRQGAGNRYPAKSYRAPEAEYSR